MLKKLEYLCSSDYLKSRESMLGLHKKNEERVSDKLYDSLYLGNPYGRPLLGLCFDGEKLVGQENYIRQDVTSNGAIRSGALGINTIVDSNYRLFYGVFKELIRMTMDRMKKDTDILCAFANEESKQYYIKYFDWKISSKVQVYKKSIGYSGLSAETLLAIFKRGKLIKDLKAIGCCIPAQHSVHPTSGSLRELEALSWLRMCTRLKWNLVPPTCG